MKVALMRPEDRLGPSADFCRASGLDAVPAPAIQVTEIEIDRQGILDAAKSSDVCVFMSAAAVDFVMKYRDLATALKSGEGLSMIAVGKATSDRLSRHSVRCTLPDRYTSEGLVEYISAMELPEKSVMVFRSDRGTDTLRTGLSGRGISVAEFAVYGIRLPRDTSALKSVVTDILNGEGYILPFSSGMMVRHFFTIAAELADSDAVLQSLKTCRVWAIGTETAKELERHGVTEINVPGIVDFEAMLLEIAASLKD